MESHHHDAKRHGKRLAGALFILVAASIALHWGWNAFMVEVISQQPMTFRQALALESLLLSTFGIVPLVWRLFSVRSK